MNVTTPRQCLPFLVTASAAAMWLGLVPRAERASPRTGEVRVLVGPEIRVSYDGEVPHAEMMIAANPLDPRNLVATSAAFNGPQGSLASSVYTSHDGGNSWTGYMPPEQRDVGGGADEVAAFGPTGTAFFLPTDGTGYLLYRSADGGNVWTRGESNGAHGDHGMIGVDNTQGPYRGTIYLASNVERQARAGDSTVTREIIQAWRSTDDGRSFADSSVVMTTDRAEVFTLLTLGDGTVVAPISFPSPTPDGASGAVFRLVTVSSLDGGRSWGSPQIIADVWRGTNAQIIAREPGWALYLTLGMPSFASDPSTRSPYRDRLYAAWVDLTNNRARIVFAHSADRGKTWSAPVPVAPAPQDGKQFAPTIAVNDDGVVGVSYYDTRGYPGPAHRFHLYFVASTDGGETFLPPSRVSTQPSLMETASQFQPRVRILSRPTAAGVPVNVFTSYYKFPTGGDYFGLVASSDGVFHPLWADSRSGTYQVYTARIEIVPPERIPPPPSASVAPIHVNDKLTVIVDPIEYDSAGLVVVMPIRLRNTSNDTLFAPVSARLLSWYDVLRPMITPTLEVLNASDGKPGIGATFDYSAALGGLAMLPPGGVSAAVLWRMRFADRRRGRADLRLDVTARMR